MSCFFWKYVARSDNDPELGVGFAILNSLKVDEDIAEPVGKNKKLLHVGRDDVNDKRANAVVLQLSCRSYAPLAPHTHIT